MQTVHKPLVPDFKQVFRASPALLALLDRDFRVVDATDAFLQATLRDRPAMLGLSIFEVYPPPAAEVAAEGPLRLMRSLERVLRLGHTDQMDFQRFDIPAPPEAGGRLEERYWNPCNAPVLGPDGQVEYILHRVEDVTDFVLARSDGRRWERVRESMRVRGEGLEAEIFLKAHRLAETNRRLVDSVARQATAISHDFNDILTALIGYADLAMTLDLDGQAEKCLREIKSAGARAAETVRLLESLAGPVPEPVRERPAIATGPLSR